jgi:Ran GTPase-activating protein (RanGAP) involved in mRNA processing and transport
MVGMASIARALACDGTALASLFLRDCGLDSDSVQRLAESLHVNGTLTKLDLSQNHLTTTQASGNHSGVHALADALRVNTALTSLELRRCSLGPEGATTLAEALKANSALRHLDLSANRICGVLDGRGTYAMEGLAALADALTINDSLEELVVGETGVDGAKMLGEALKRNGSLATIHLSEGRPLPVKQLKGTQPTDSLALSPDGFCENSLMYDESLVLAGVLVGANSSLISLEMCGGLCGLHPLSCDTRGRYTTARITAVSEGLKCNTSLKSLHLQRNWMKDDGAKVIADYLKSASSLLEKLDLSQNRIGANGAATLADALCENTSLTTLDLGENVLGNAGATAIANALIVNRSLAVLDLAGANDGKGGARIGDEGAKAFAEALRVNDALTSLDLDFQSIRSDGAAAIADALCTNSTLATLKLNWNQIRAHWDDEAGEDVPTPNGPMALATTLAASKSLIELAIRESNPLGPGVAEAFAEAVERNVSLTSLDISGWLSSPDAPPDGAAATKLSTAVLGNLKMETYNTIPIKSMRANSFTELTSETFSRKGRRCHYPTDIGDEGCILVAGLLPAMTLLTKLRLKRSTIGDAGAKLLADAAAKSSLTTLDLRSNQIGDAGAEAIAALITVSTCLAKLYLNENRIGDVGAKSIAGALAASTSLAELDLDENRIGDAGATALAQALSLADRASTLMLKY